MPYVYVQITRAEWDIFISIFSDFTQVTVDMFLSSPVFTNVRWQYSSPGSTVGPSMNSSKFFVLSVYNSTLRRETDTPGRIWSWFMYDWNKLLVRVYNLYAQFIMFPKTYPVYIRAHIMSCTAGFEAANRNLCWEVAAIMLCKSTNQGFRHTISHDMNSKFKQLLQWLPLNKVDEPSFKIQT